MDLTSIARTTFVGSVIIYSYLQAIGVIVSREENYFIYEIDNPYLIL